MIKKILTPIIIMTLLITSITAIGIKTNTLSNESERIFYDNFDDNEKNHDLWTEIYDDGIWEETNNRVEFEVQSIYPEQVEAFEGIVIK